MQWTIRSMDQSFPLCGKFSAHHMHQHMHMRSLIISFHTSTPYPPQETTATVSKCSEAQVLSAPKYELFEVLPEEKIAKEEDTCMVALPWEMTDEKVQSALTQFMVWASLTRDMEMQEGAYIDGCSFISISALLCSQ
jgi:hypothetical protein